MSVTTTTRFQRPPTRFDPVDGLFWVALAVVAVLLIAGGVS